MKYKEYPIAEVLKMRSLKNLRLQIMFRLNGNSYHAIAEPSGRCNCEMCNRCRKDIELIYKRINELEANQRYF